VTVWFDERWIPEDQLAATAALAAGTNGLPGEVIEIGVWQGRSAIPIANAVWPARLHAVDHWRGGWDDPAGVAAGLALDPAWVASRDNYGIFLANIAEGTRGNVTVHKTGWRQFAAAWDQPIRFLHLDASHTTREVSDNIAALLPYAVPGAVFSGDDYYREAVIAAVREHFPQVHTGPAQLWWVTL
jgi:methyltransferase family protein